MSTIYLYLVIVLEKMMRVEVMVLRVFCKFKNNFRSTSVLLSNSPEPPALSTYF